MLNNPATPRPPVAKRTPSEFAEHYPEFRGTSWVDELRAVEYRNLQDTGTVYLDYAGAGLAARSQLRGHAERIAGQCFGNPHSENPTSTAATELVEQTRTAIRDYFHASSTEYDVIFTPNASGACKLVGESYPFGADRRCVLTFDNHNSVNGIREFARAAGAETEYVPSMLPELRVSEAAVFAALDRGGSGQAEPGSRGLFAYPAQSNFTGVQHPLEWIEAARRRGYDVLLDAAAFVPTNRLDLSKVHPDFVCVSWYKVFGYPTGVGCLVARRDSLARLRRPWFAGGTIRAVSVQGDWHVLADDHAAFEDGTLNFLSVPDVGVGLSWISTIGIATVHTRVRCLVGWLLERLTALRHGNDAPMVRVYGPTSTERRGGTVTLNLLDPAGRVVDERLVARESAAQNFSLRTGCFCNPGAGEDAFHIESAKVDRDEVRGFPKTIDEYVTAIGLPSGGAVRVSLGLVSNVDDVDRFVEFVETTYRDRFPDSIGLEPRLTC